MFLSKWPVAIFVPAALVCVDLGATAATTFAQLPPLESCYPEFAMPADSGFTDVRKDCGAQGDGATDDTDALEAAIGSPTKGIKGSRAIYLPDGTYLVSRPLAVGDKKKFVQGQSRQGTVIRLKDNCPGFGDPNEPAFMLDMKGEQHFAQNFYVHTHNTNRGGDLWILGIKTEKDRSIVDTTEGGRTELFGGFLYKNRQRVGPAPAFTSTDSQVSYNYKAIGVPYAVQVQETRGVETRELPVETTGGSCVLFVGRP